MSKCRDLAFELDSSPYLSLQNTAKAGVWQSVDFAQATYNQINDRAQVRNLENVIFGLMRDFLVKSLWLAKLFQATKHTKWVKC